MRSWPVLLALLVAGCAAPAGEPAPPTSVVVLGDSISRAMNVQEDQLQDNPAHSWATGLAADDPVSSYLERLRDKAPDVEIVGFNNARSGAVMADVPAQAALAARQRAEHVLLLAGANDACASTPAQMTPVDAFRRDLEAAADALPGGASVLVLSIPDVTKLAAAFEGNETARAVWRAFRICPSALGENGDAAAVRDRIAAYNAALADVARERGWRHDDGALFKASYDAAHVSKADFFHPSLEGQARLAALAWDAGPFSS